MAYIDTVVVMFQKIRALTEDFVQSSTEVFVYETSNIFTLSEPRVIDMTQVLLNGQDLQSGQSADYDDTNNDITVVNEDFVSGDIVTVKYTYAKTSDLELLEYIRAALVWLTIYDSDSNSFKLSQSGLIIPTPKDKTLDLICIIASILIKPDYISYRTGNMAVTYPTKATKEEKILDSIQIFKTGIGVIGIIEYNKIF